MKLTNIVSLLTIFLLVCACSSTSKSPYKPANNAGFGYKDILLTDNAYRIEFKYNGNSKKAHSYALLRAAEITSAQGYDWFVVVKRDTVTESEKKSAGRISSPRPVITRNCGLLTCRDSIQTLPATDINNDFAEANVTAVAEIKMGKGVRPALDNTYDAYETYEKLRAQSL